MFSIIGRGFGSYGYAPALDKLGLPHVAVDRFEQIETPHVVVAINPKHQPSVARKLMNNRAVESLLLEKPLAETPREAKALLDDLKMWGGKFRIGYLFSDTEWADAPLSMIHWEFMAHHYANGLDNWKRRLGIVRYYGIHIIALLSSIGYENILASEHGESDWYARFSSPTKPPCDVLMNSKSDRPMFRVDGCEYGSPFGKDDRVTVLARSIKRYLDSPQMNYGPEINLWEQVEA